MVLEQCVKVVLCGLLGTTRAALDSLIENYKIALTAELASLNAYKAYLDIATAPVATANALAQSALAQAQAGANFLPTSLVATCVGLGELNAAVQVGVDVASRTIRELAQDLQRRVSLSAELAESIRIIQEKLSFYSEIQEILANC